MKKQEQLQINDMVKYIYSDCTTNIDHYGVGGVERLRYCSAYTATTKGYDLLYSYGTLIACYDHETEKVYDFLRMVYGYTATSAQHINKFSQDFGKRHGYKWSVPIVRWYAV